jgi:hypothetical protein
MHHTLINYHVLATASDHSVQQLRSWCQVSQNQSDFVEITEGDQRRYTVSLREVIGETGQCEQRLLEQFGKELVLYRQD